MGYTWNNEFNQNGVLIAVLCYGGHLVMTGKLLAGNYSMDFIKCVERDDDIAVSDHLTADNLLTFLLYQIQLGENIYWAAFVVAGIMDCVGASRKVFEYMHRKPAMALDGTEKPALRGTVRFDDVYFTYPTRPNNLVLKGLSLIIPAGSIVALVGPSGGGKSSIVSLLQHMYEPDSGSITIDGIPIKQIDHEYYHENDEVQSSSLRSVGAAQPRCNVTRQRLRLGDGESADFDGIRLQIPTFQLFKLLKWKVVLVAQEPVLYNGSIRDNILYGCGWATETDMLEAAEMANVHGFVMELEKKYDTLCGDRGVQMSGGQKQRIAIARALVRKPCVLILDEATSALDAESEAQVQEAINRCSGKLTVLIVAHRLSTVEKADTIAVIQKGSVIQIGTHESLMEEPEGLYYALVSKQLLTAMS